ncbi:dynactin subunit 2 [Neocloeon triangulifer]|uniref:dynactin subunit 2 n=1 Tax=Neocloeon triangulifer TaxID=2078957 RepID=UPI00286F3C05|nr:dynactin subunit 2 [Neocloeon triangulifer]
MADSKYADLPGIAYDQPDVYETEDLPEADQNLDAPEEDNEFIDKPNLNVDTAFGKFRGKILISDRVDFSDRLSRNIRTGYDALSCEFELVGRGENETPIQKFQRLQCEITELGEEINKLKGSAKEDGSAVPSAVQVQNLMQQLTELRLEEQLGSELVASLADPQGAELRKLLAQIELTKSAPVEGKKPGGDTKLSSKAPASYELLFKPEQMKLQQTARVAQLEQRLHALETSVGDVPNKLSRLSSDTNTMCLAAAVQHLSRKASLLDSAQLDHIEGRLTALSTKMNQLAEQSSASKEENHQDKKVSEMYDLIVKCEQMTASLPDIAQRLAAIHSLHEQALTFSKTLAQLGTLQEQISASLGGNEVQLKEAQKAFSQNLEIVKKNMEGLDARIAALKKK